MCWLFDASKGLFLSYVVHVLSCPGELLKLWVLSMRTIATVGRNRSPTTPLVEVVAVTELEEQRDLGMMEQKAGNIVMEVAIVEEDEEGAVVSGASTTATMEGGDAEKEEGEVKSQLSGEGGLTDDSGGMVWESGDVPMLEKPLTDKTGIPSLEVVNYAETVTLSAAVSSMEGGHFLADDNGGKV